MREDLTVYQTATVIGDNGGTITRPIDPIVALNLFHD